MAKSAKMESTSISIYTWLATAAICILAFAGYRYYKKYRVENVRANSYPVDPNPKNGKTLSTLRNRCWETYIELENLRSLKNKCAKIVAGDIGVFTAMHQLDSILNSGKSTEYMAPRIIGQVCDFIINMATANKMIDDMGNIIMPKASHNPLDERSYFENIHTTPAEQSAKYEAVIKYQTAELQLEKNDMRFIHLLQELLPSLQTIAYLTNNEEQLSADEIVAKADNIYKEISPIISKYEYKK